ncbi:hypothetical protein [Stenotrophomonas pictorum]|uniref:hypothetical protein n=1 Tax=Stenotrophomonas pictorum TaxID=86184 RepID=UPI000A427623|nr:hypothetical protein [Stenotrophomonas pictorum]
MKRHLTHTVRALIRRRWRPADMPACRAQIAAAAAALDDESPGVQGADALALREQLRVDAARQRQRVIPLYGVTDVTPGALRDEGKSIAGVSLARATEQTPGEGE